ncbi:MAG: cytochrome c [Candidatus Acidiferrales bacterium]
MKSAQSAGSSKGKSFAARTFLIPGIGLAAVLIAYAGATIGPAQADAPKPPKTTEEGAYTDTQAKQGKDVYTQNCASCHLDDLSGSGQALPLAGDSFMQSWEGQTVDDLYEVIHDTMPQDKPGTLTPDQVVQVISYILKFNKFPAGQTELPSDPAAMKNILITTKKPSAAPPTQPPSPQPPPAAQPPPPTQPPPSPPPPQQGTGR